MARPTHVLSARHRNERGTVVNNKVGVLWAQDGYMTLRLLPGVRLNWDDAITLAVFSASALDNQDADRDNHSMAPQERPKPDINDEIPF